MEATLEHPFFVFGQGWSSCQPDRTAHRFGLSCHRLSVGDVCISLTHKDVTSRVEELTAAHNATSRSPTPPLSVPLNGDGRYTRSENSSIGDNAASPGDRTTERVTSADVSGSVHSGGTRSPTTPHTDTRHGSSTPDRKVSTSPDMGADATSNITISVDDDVDDDSLGTNDTDSAAARLAATTNVRSDNQ